MKILRYSIVLLPLVALLAACGATSSSHQSAPPLDYATLVERLRADGATVEPAGNATAYPIVTPLGRMISLNGARVSVFEYQDADAAQTEAAHVSPDGSAYTGDDSDRRSAVLDWTSAPRWYHAGPLIVLYVGLNSEVADLLRRELGAPFAGPYADRTESNAYLNLTLGDGSARRYAS